MMTSGGLPYQLMTLAFPRPNNDLLVGVLLLGCVAASRGLEAGGQAVTFDEELLEREVFDYEDDEAEADRQEE